MLKNLVGRNYFGNTGAAGYVPLNWISKEENVMLWTGMNWFSGSCEYGRS
jgi:hypothetical protein